jgi:DeoR family glycerol-3-phosphate regulon repressor
MMKLSKKTLNKRQQDIINLARKEGFVTVEHLSEYFKVTQQTIRRDLGYLSENLYLARTYGGAFFQSGISNFNYTARETIAQEDKQEIAKVVSKIVPDNASIILNIGTTTEQVAKTLLASHKGLKIITNNINIVNLASHSNDCEVWVTGGKVRTGDNAVVGKIASDFISQFKIDYAIVGVSAIDEDGSLLDFDHDEVLVSKSIFENCRNLILVADGIKFDRKAPFLIGNLSQVDIFVTNIQPSKKILKICSTHNVELIDVNTASNN